MTPQPPVKLEAIGDDGVKVTALCGECGAAMYVTIADVPPFTRKVAQSLFQAAAGSSSVAPRLTVVCGRCDRNAALARR